MTKNAGYKSMKYWDGVRQQKDADRLIAATKVDEKATRKSKAAKQREADADLMKKSLATYPKNPRVWEFKSAPKENAGKPKKAKVEKAEKHPAELRAERKAVRQEEKRLKKEQRLKEREEKKAAKALARQARQSVKFEYSDETILETVQQVMQLPSINLPVEIEKGLITFAKAFGKEGSIKQEHRAKMIQARAFIAKSLIEKRVKDSQINEQ